MVSSLFQGNNLQFSVEQHYNT